MPSDSRSTAGVLTAACALILGVLGGCTEVNDTMAARLAADEAALPTSSVCDGTYNCELPNPNP